MDKFQTGFDFYREALRGGLPEQSYKTYEKLGYDSTIKYTRLDIF